MFKNRYNKVLTIVLTILIILIISSVGYIIYDSIVVKTKLNEAEEIASEFTNTVSEKKIIKKKDTSSEEEVDEEILNEISNYQENENANSNNQGILNEKQDNKVYMEGYEVMGTIQIPKTGVNLPILEKVTKKSLETSVAILEGVGLNQQGNTVIVGHNYRNKLFFSDNKKLVKGDIIIIIDQTGTSISYEIYDTFITQLSDTDYIRRDTEGRREISLSTCTDDSNDDRLIILAREK